MLLDVADTFQFFPAALISSFISFCILNIYLKARRMRKLWKWRHVKISILCGYLAAVFFIALLSRAPGSREGINLRLFSTLINPRLCIYFLENIVFFAPLGLLLPAIFKTQKRLFVCLETSAGLSLLIELLQLFTKRGFCQIDDVFSNALGAAMGFLLYCFAAKRLNGS